MAKKEGFGKGLKEKLQAAAETAKNKAKEIKLPSAEELKVSAKSKAADVKEALKKKEKENPELTNRLLKN